MKTILHLDMNSYFATAEQQMNPKLRGKPVGVIKALGRGCIIAASVEAKKYGVKTGTTVWEAKKLCPHIILVPSDMNKYFAMTKKLIKIADDYSPIVEVFSIDEFFLDVTDTQKLYGGGVWELAIELKMRVRQELGEWMRCSVGVAWSKILAKLASEMHKPDGLTMFSPENYLEETKNVAVEEVCGIGRARTTMLQCMGVRTLGEARQRELPKEIADLVWLREENPLVTVEDLQPAKSVSRTYTTYKVLGAKGQVLRLIRNLVEEAAGKLREMNMCGRTYSLYLTPNPSPNISLRSGRWPGEGHYRVTVKIPTDDPKIIYDLLIKEYNANPLLEIRFAGVTISNLIFNYQFLIFNQRQKLLNSVDKINKKYGGFTIYPAQLLGGELIRPEITGFLGDKYYQFIR